MAKSIESHPLVQVYDLVISLHLNQTRIENLKDFFFFFFHPFFCHFNIIIINNDILLTVSRITIMILVLRQVFPKQHEVNYFIKDIKELTIVNSCVTVATWQSVSVQNFEI